MKAPRAIALLTTLLLTGGLAAQADTVEVGKFSAKIVPEQVASLNFPSKGEVTDLLYDSTQRVEKGTIIAILNKDKTAEEREDMELLLARERLTKTDEIRKLKHQREKVVFYLKLSKEERTYAKDLRPAEGEDVSKEALEEIDERINLLQQELKTLERRKRAEFDTKHDPLTLKMPFTGRLQYHFTLPENRDEPMLFDSINMRSFATVCDDSAYYITLSLSNTDYTLLPAENFSVYISLPQGRRLSATYSYRRIEHGNNGSDVLLYFFKISPEDHETAYTMLGSSAQAVLMYTPSQDVEIVYKSDLLAHPAAVNCASWDELVRVARPGHALELVADRHLLIRKITQPDQTP